MLNTPMPGLRYFDISPKLSSRIAVFPGDTAFEREVAMEFQKGHPFALSSIKTTVHVGAHVDAPSHYHARGESIEQRSLDYYFGPCQVITVKPFPGERVGVIHLTQKIDTPRVLFRTGSFEDPNQWKGDFNALSPELIDHLAARGVRLVGIDTLSIDLAEDKILASHQRIFANDMAILEGIVLDSVEDGVYWLSALPLAIEGGDASPVRAVLFQGTLLQDVL